MLNLLRREDLFSSLEREADKFFDEFFGPKRLPSLLNSVKRSGYPKLDVLVMDGKFRIEVAVPGVDPNDLKIEVLPNGDQRLLRLTGKMAHDYQYSNNVDYHHRELTRARFQRVISLPEGVCGDPEAVIKNGMLTLTWTLEKPQEVEAKLIPIKQE